MNPIKLAGWVPKVVPGRPKLGQSPHHAIILDHAAQSGQIT
jgi:hypothetical protein